ncbi:MAG: NAD(P)-dependent oxidoreductase [Promethearchaeota archaeon]|jgi:L-ribulose-5-phosphate 4-epimerase
MKALITASISDEVLKELGTLMEITYESWRDTGIIYLDAKELIEKLKGYDIFITTADDLKKSELFDHTNLKLIVSCRGDPFNVNLNAAIRNNIPVIFTPLRNVDAVAELTIGFMISLVRNLSQLNRFLHSEEFEIIDFEDWIQYYNRFIGIELLNKTVGIIGFGLIGRRVAERLKSFGVNFLIYDPFLPDEVIDEIGRKVDIDTLMRNSDIITVHAAATEENDNLINRERIAMMKNTAYLLNLAKGSLVDYEALFKALKEKQIAGAALDVFPLEPIDEDNEFLELDNVIVAPHIGGNTKEVIVRQSNMLLNDIKLWLNYEKPKHVLNPEVFNETEKKVRPNNIKIDNLKKKILDTCKKLLDDGHVIGSAGNVSVRVNYDDEELILITPSNVNYDIMKPNDILLIDFNGKVVQGVRNPSVEKHLHLGIYKAREDVNAIIHSHGIYSTILSTLNLSLPPVMEELVPYLGGEIACAKYGEAGTEDLAEIVLSNLEEKNAVILANHGSICCGSHLEGAYTVLQYLERGAKVYYFAKLIKDPNMLPEDTIDYEKDIFEIFKESKKI